MRKSLLTFALILLALTTLTSFSTSNEATQQKRYAVYGIGFYNIENFFDTIHDAGKNDYEFLPKGGYSWGKMKYEHKLHNISKVLSMLCTDKLPKVGAAVIGLAEVENVNVLNDLVSQPCLAQRGYKYVDIPSYDRRGVECAFLYNPNLFKLERHFCVQYNYGPSGKVDDPMLGFTVDARGKVQAIDHLQGDTTYITRGFLVMEGRLSGEKMFFIVNHWPSRAAGDETRQRAGWQVRQLKDALQKSEPGAKVIIMGDMNDDPGNKSMTEQLACLSDQEDVKSATDLYNPWHNSFYKSGQGTMQYNGKWFHFDQIVVSGNLVGKDRSSLKYFQHAIFMRDFLFQQEGRYKGSPLRTHAGGVWLDGYSDHLPTQLYLVKEVK